MCVCVCTDYRYQTGSDALQIELGGRHYRPGWCKSLQGSWVTDRVPLWAPIELMDIRVPTYPGALRVTETEPFQICDVAPTLGCSGGATFGLRLSSSISHI